MTLLGGAATAWPVVARAQQRDEVRRIGVLLNLPEHDPEAVARNAAFRQKLQELGWTEGRNLRIDYRWGPGDSELYRRYAEELVALAPDVILGSGLAVRELQQVTRTVPIVFTAIIDPVALGYVASLTRPGGNVTGFFVIEYSFSGKWLELLKQIAPRVTRAAVLLDPSVAVGLAQFEAIQAVAPSFGVELSQADVRDFGGMERAITAFAREANGGLIVTAGTMATVHRDLIITLAARHRLPAVYPNRLYVTAGGLIYVDRILRGAKPADLPVQSPTQYETVLNLKTAKALDLDVKRSLLAQANEVIQ